MTTEAVAARERLLRQELARFIEIVTQQMQPERIILFGSFAAGQVSEWSDLDLVVITPTELPYLVRAPYTPGATDSAPPSAPALRHVAL